MDETRDRKRLCTGWLTEEAGQEAARMMRDVFRGTREETDN